MSLTSASAWWRLWVLAAVVLVHVSASSCELYTREYQSFPALDWLDARPSLDESAGVQPAQVLVRGLERSSAGLLLRGSLSTFSPSFTPPGLFQRSIAGVRDTAEASFSPGPDPGAADVSAVVRLKVLVFHRSVRAPGWIDLFSTQRDLGRSEGGVRQLRTSGPDETDRVWVSKPGTGGSSTGTATVAGVRGPIAFVLEATTRTGADELEAAALAERLARSSAAAWTAWLISREDARAR